MVNNIIGAYEQRLHKEINFFFFNDTATTEIYTLSLHDALPIYLFSLFEKPKNPLNFNAIRISLASPEKIRSEEHTSELQSQSNLVCRLLLEKKNSKIEKRIFQTTYQHD